MENLCLADTSLQRTLFLGPNGVRYREVPLYIYFENNFFQEQGGGNLSSWNLFEKPIRKRLYQLSTLWF